MKWFEGSIPVAIQQAKANKALFVVYIYGEDDLSKSMEETWADGEVSTLCEQSQIVALRLDVKSEPCQQFSAIYPVVLIPSTFFIGENGVPVEVSGGSFTPKAFVEKINMAKQLHQAQLKPAAPTQTTSTPTPAQPTQAVTPVTEEPAASSSVAAATETQPAAATNEAQPAQQTVSLEEKVERAKELLEEKREQKAMTEKEKAKQQEVERREIGKNMLKAKQWREDYQTKEAADKRRKEKEDDKRARERVRAQIAQDKEARAARFRKEKDERETAATQAKQAKLETKAQEEARQAASRSETARIQFRLPNGSSVTQQFPSSDPLQSARNYIAQHVSGSLGNNFVIKTSFPKRTFSGEDMQSTLLDLGLTPTAVLLVLPGTQSGSSPSSPGGGPSVFQTLLAPLLALWNLIYTFLFGTASTPAVQQGETRDNGDGATGQTPSSAYKRPGSNPRRTPDGNVHRLFSGNRGDDDDENATWNGNSTQQM